MKAKHLDFGLFKSDVDKFKASGIAGTTSELLTSYVTEYEKQGVVSANDILSMFLIAAIELREHEVVKGCLDLLTDGISLTNTDETGYSAITSMLFSGDLKIQVIFDEYLAKNSAVTNKVEPSEGDFDHIVRILEYPRFKELDTNNCLEKYIAPLYSVECVGNITTELSEIIE